MPSRLIDTTSALVQAALHLTTPSQHVDHPHAVDAAHEQLILAARDLVRAVNGLEPSQQPHQWSKPVPGTVNGHLVSPEVVPYCEDGENCGACSEIQDLCRYHEGYAAAERDVKASLAAAG